ncbi:hypothetical protein HBI39_055650 [Parastagonospora nodorum]|nr:hypothetical protein HBI51_030210 [Parastagonospora nodorum]KAH6124744.1 hypothetical protein HBI69_043320 [Parastagonospora nodorum]KAH6312922.1 hypothetical protein HBI39_055650 [Parastagonospora nodorum]
MLPPALRTSFLPLSTSLRSFRTSTFLPSFRQGKGHEQAAVTISLIFGLSHHLSAFFTPSVRSFRTAVPHRRTAQTVLSLCALQLTYAPYHSHTAMASNSTAIPLHCNICPKRPNFSDVSHLLTHIASKGHLSNYYKVKVRSSHEEASRQLIDAYDRWYASWGVEQLMSERMNQKDKRRSRARPMARPAPVPTVEAPAPRTTRRAAVGNLVDPQLSDQQVIKTEPLDSPTPSARPGPVLRHRTFAPHMQYWATESRASSRSYTNPDYETSSEYSDPGERRRYRYDAADSCAVEDDPAEAAEDPMAVSESTKLKGVYWPGMDIFDSATPEMRRKRNQKKDSSVVAQLELNSQDVEAMEFIFTPGGSFKRQRRISNAEYDDEEETEIKTESPQPTRARPALARLDANARRPRHQTRSMFPFHARTQYEDRGRSIFDNVQSDRASKRKRGGFSVYRDDDEEEITFSQPASMTYLTSGFTRQPSPSPAPAFTSYKALNEGYQYDNKENALPAFPQQGYGSYHGYQGAGFHQQNYAYGLAQDQRAFQYNDHMYNGNQMYQQNHQDDDDQRTITAPPSPSMS